MKELIITKASGETAIFEMDKLRRSMRNSGATEQQIEHVVKEIEPKLYQGIPTKKIYSWAFGMLKKESKPVAARYQLKKAIMEFGSTGFPFEDYVGELFERIGYHTKVSTIVQGKCVKHEIDVIASNTKEHLLIECKYHSQPGKMSDVKVALYIQSRFLDVKEKWLEQSALKNKDMQGWVVTNTRFSPDAVAYGQCIGLHLMSWDYPLNNSLKGFIDEHKLYPITCITGITLQEKTKLLLSKTVLCSSLLDNPTILSDIGISSKRINSILSEIKMLLN